MNKKILVGHTSAETAFEQGDYTITDEQIAALSRKARQAGDMLMVDTCNTALDLAGCNMEHNVLAARAKCAARHRRGDDTVVSRDEWVRLRSSGAVGHADCLKAFNSTISCGADHGDCLDQACCFSARYLSDADIRSMPSSARAEAALGHGPTAREARRTLRKPAEAQS